MRTPLLDKLMRNAPQIRFFLTVHLDIISHNFDHYCGHWEYSKGTLNRTETDLVIMGKICWWFICRWPCQHKSFLTVWPTVALLSEQKISKFVNSSQIHEVFVHHQVSKVRRFHELWKVASRRAAQIFKFAFSAAFEGLWTSGPSHHAASKYRPMVK